MKAGTEHESPKDLSAREVGRVLLESAQDAIFVMDGERFIDCNPATLHLFGCRRDQIVGKDPVRFSPPLQPDGQASAHAARKRIAAALGGTPQRFEWRHRQLRGVEFDAEVSLNASEVGGQLVCLAVVRDITARKRAEAALRRSEQESRALVEALHEANARLQEVDRRKNEFLAMLSHELRNPLAPILSSLCILERTAPGGDQARRAQAVIARQAHHLTRLVNDLLDVTRIVRGKIQLHLERLEFVGLLQETMADHGPLFASSGVAVDFDPTPTELWVRGDRTRLAQVVGNLLQNAAKFTPAGGRVRVAVEQVTQGRLTLTVADTGAGIDPQMLPRLFLPFTQAEMTLDRGKGGLGLGLAVVKGLVEEHGGTATAASEGPGLGASFCVHLPLASPVEERRPADPMGSAAGAVSRRVLVVEDIADAAESLRELLELRGHQVAVALSGAEGLALARSFRPEVVLCDLGLPGMDGFEVAMAMRADPVLARLRLIALSGYAGPEDVARCREAGFDQHLAKPPSLEQLEGALRSAAGPEVAAVRSAPAPAT
ncbi:MAG: ATP-binding protein [Myxococcales bacterium]